LAHELSRTHLFPVLHFSSCVRTSLFPFFKSPLANRCILYLGDDPPVKINFFVIEFPAGHLFPPSSGSRNEDKRKAFPPSPHAAPRIPTLAQNPPAFSLESTSLPMAVSLQNLFVGSLFSVFFCTHVRNSFSKANTKLMFGKQNPTLLSLFLRRHEPRKLGPAAYPPRDASVPPNRPAIFCSQYLDLMYFARYSNPSSNLTLPPLSLTPLTV